MAFSVAHGGRSDIKNHLQSQRHKASVASVSASSQLDTFFKRSETTEPELLVAAKEATFAFHAVSYDLSFKTSDHSSKLVSKFVEPNFHLARTKREVVILNAIAPMAKSELAEDLAMAHFVTISMDASNRKDVKIIPFMMRDYCPGWGAPVKLLDMHTVPDETAETLTDALLSAIDKHGLKEKVVGFCGDNCNANYNCGVTRKRQEQHLQLIKNQTRKEPCWHSLWCTHCTQLSPNSCWCITIWYQSHCCENFQIFSHIHSLCDTSKRSLWCCWSGIPKATTTW